MKIVELDRRSFAFKAGWAKYKVLVDHVGEAHLVDQFMNERFGPAGHIWYHTNQSGFRWNKYNWYIKQDNNADQRLLRTDEQATLLRLSIPKTELKDFF